MKFLNILTSFVGEFFTFLGGVVVGVILTIYRLAPVVNKDPFPSPIFYLPVGYYLTVAAGLIGVGILLRLLTRQSRAV